MMKKHQLPTTEKPEILIQSVSGDLNLKGQAENEVLLKSGVDEGIVFTHTENQVTIVCPGECTLYVPHAARVKIETVAGNTSVKAFDGELTLEMVGGELIVRDVGSIYANKIGTDLSARRVRGDLVVNQIGRGAIIRDLDGRFQCINIGAHLNLKDVSGGVSAKTGGHAEISLAPVPWQSYTITAGGNISCSLIAETNAKVEIQSGANNINVNLPELKKRIKEGSFSAEIGEGGAKVSLTAGGSVNLRSRASGWDFFGTYENVSEFDPEELDHLTAQIELQVNSQLDAISEQVTEYIQEMETQLTDENLSPKEQARIHERIERAQERISRNRERAHQKMNIKLEAARRKLEQKTRRKMEQQVRAQQMNPPMPPITPSPSKRFIWPPKDAQTQPESKDSVSEEERLLILKMLEEQQITATEAEQLLTALEGGDS